jgi:hypothetical protein
MKNICFLFYTNEQYLPILDITNKEFDKFFPENNIKKIVVSNKFSDYEFSHTNFEKIDTQVPFDGMGNHFEKVMTKALNSITEEYIIFFCDDYMLIDKPNIEKLNNLVEFIQKNQVDYFTFASVNPKQDWKTYSLPDYISDNHTFYQIPYNYQYHYSVQPCIWKKSSLLEILKHNTDLSLHGLDTTNIKNRQGYRREMNYETSIWKDYENGEQSYGFNCVATDYRAFDETENYDFFIFPYVEIIRHGHFNMQYETNTKRFLQNFIIENKLNTNKNYTKFLL